MKKLFILILLFSGILHATIDERKSDVYFANGINTTDSEADISLQFLALQFEAYDPTAYTSVANWDTVYNHTPSFHLSRGGTHIATIKETHGQKPL